MSAALSATELKSALYRMLTGSGIDVGAAEDLARAGALGARYGLPVCAELLDGLSIQRPDADISDNRLIWHGVVESTAALSSVDMLQAGLVKTVQANKIAVPLIASILPLVLAPELTIETQAEGRRMTAHAGHLYMQEDSGFDGVDISVLPQVDSLPPALHTAPIYLEKPVWKAISDLAAKSYVPATAASRSSGAGAGLTDND